MISKDFRNVLLLLIVVGAFILVVQPYTLSIGRTLILFLGIFFPPMIVFYFIRIKNGWGMSTDFNIWVKNRKWIKPEKARKQDRTQAKLNFFTLLLISAVCYFIIFYFY